ncbi:BRCT domain-containing protein [Aeromonas salmonicida]|uniref:BRCT domain-containing protein n=1 Tax=Aeromonas salmonicida TaxID=645 RepID=UPI003D032025
MFDLYSAGSIIYQGNELPVFNLLYLSNKGVVSAKRMAAYHSDPDRKLVYGMQMTIATDNDRVEMSFECPTFVSLRTDRVLDVFETQKEALEAYEQAHSRYAERILQIKSDPGYHGRKLLPKDYSFKVCFTGFTKADKAELTELAEAAGMKVVTGVSASLDFLCCGDNAGWSKMKKANELGVPLVRDEQIRLLVETGELPESYCETR